MRLQLLQVPDCPGAATLIGRLSQLAGGRAEVKQQMVHDLDQATLLRMTGSPTLLIDGVDPFAVDGLPPSLSCRIYRDENGSLSSAPSLAQLRAALGYPSPLAPLGGGEERLRVSTRRVSLSAGAAGWRGSRAR